MATHSNKKRAAAPAPEEKIENALGKTEKFLQDNSKALLTVLLAVVIVVGGYFGYRYLHVVPRQQKAAEAMFAAEQRFAVDSFRLALYGDGNEAGFEEVVSRYGNTPQGRLAAHYAGICCMKLGDPDGALEYLKKYRPADGAPAAIVNAQNYGLRGDIYADRGDYAEAARMYEKAVAAADNVLTTPYYLKKAALVYKAQGRTGDALAAYRQITDQWKGSLEARDADKYIGRLEQQE